MYNEDMGKAMYIDAIAGEKVEKVNLGLVEYVSDCFAAIGISDIDKRVEMRRRAKDIALQVAGGKDNVIIRSLKTDACFLKEMIKDDKPVIDRDVLYEIAEDMLKAVTEIQRLEQHIVGLVD